MTQSRDLFDDSTMTIPEHLDILRYHLWRAIIGLVICVIFSLFYGSQLVAIVRGPIDRALASHGVTGKAQDDISDFDFMKYMSDWWNDVEPPVEEEEETPANEIERDTIVVSVQPSHLIQALGNRVLFNPDAKKDEQEKSPEVEPSEKIDAEKEGKGAEKPTKEKPIKLKVTAPEFAQLKRAVEEIDKPKTFNVQEAFMTYLKVSLVFGLVLSSPWVFFQIWLFVAAGLYPHERRYVYIYLPMSITLFIGGAVFCFVAVFPFVLKFLLGFNTLLGVQPQIRLSEWISFAIFLPVMFGISFQLPMVMLFLERISVFEAETYRSSRRMSILVIAFLSMLLTPADPMSMLMMMIPLIFLYEFGILLTRKSSKKSPFEESPA